MMPRTTGRKKTSGTMRGQTKTTNRSRLRKRQKPKRNNKRGLRVVLFAFELVSLLLILAIAIITLLSLGSSWFSGSDWLSHQLPFIGMLTVSVLILSLFITAWWMIRTFLKTFGMPLPSLVMVAISVVTIWFALQTDYFPVYRQFKNLLGGKQTIRANMLSHQIFAAYRRENLVSLQNLIKNSIKYHGMIEEAAEIYGLDSDMLKGVAAVESSFNPRNSVDGGRGLFQITRVPKEAIKDVENRLSERIILTNSKHNTYVASATLKYYLNQMNNDPVLGLLAYNIGPANGGLKYIMSRYGATDFVTIQPYLQKYPRDYPIRVLSKALAFRIWHQYDRLLPYATGQNPLLIQQLGIPGLLRP